MRCCESPDHRAGEFDDSAAALAEAFGGAEFEPMPSQSVNAASVRARAVMSEEPAGPARLRCRSGSRPSGARPGGIPDGWLAAAACPVLAVFGWLPKPSATAPTNPRINTTGNAQTLLEERQAFLESTPTQSSGTS